MFFSKRKEEVCDSKRKTAKERDCKNSKISVNVTSIIAGKSN